MMYHPQLATYNYIVDPGIRETFGIDCRNTVVIIDEAHNLEDALVEVSSCHLPVTLLQQCFEELRAVIDTQQPALQKDAALLLRLVDALLRWREGCHGGAEAAVTATSSSCNDEASAKARVFAGSELLSLLDAAHLADWGAVVQLSAAMESLAVADLNRGRKNKQQQEGAAQAEEARRKQRRANQQLLSGPVSIALKDTIKVIRFFLSGERSFVNDFKLVYEKEDDSVSVWCMYPGVAFFPIANAALSVILTSGTLAPMGLFCSELGTSFPITIELNHFVTHEQVFVSAVTSSGGVDLTLTYQRVQQRNVMDAIGAALLAIAQVTPGGLLCFFPSYGVMNHFCRHFAETGVMDKLRACKPAFFTEEQRRGGAASFAASLGAYKAAISAGRGGAFLGVCRGKLSEGLDFADDMARTVVVIGIPYPAVQDPRVATKRQYNDQQCAQARLCAQQQQQTQQPQLSSSPSPPTSQQQQLLQQQQQTQQQLSSSPASQQPHEPQQQRTISDGSTWYTLQGLRAVNQAVGRIIRHRGDYGAVVLLDARYARPSTVAQLSRWLRGFLHVDVGITEPASRLARFFANAAVKFPPPQAQPVVPAQELSPVAALLNKHGKL
eukprot:TRINITY_DN1820_c0_g1_i2.p1 TRINITY_DN1820_c0_g1~~TRINITY_DN1820_c0_g1_i2.p1  ORF type:complete len:610 (-),score=178.14 TRINITY_DN1820_c0_g1_i2:26-1855(-)